MKNFLSKNWKNIIFVICIIAIIVNTVIIFMTPASVVKEFALYGPTVQSDTIDKTKDTGESIVCEAKEGTNSLTEYVQERTDTSDSNARLIVCSSLLVCGVIILSNIIDDSSSSGKSDAKKK